MIVDYLELGGLEVINTARLRAYLQNVGSPLDSGAQVCACPTLTAEVLDDDPYDTPATDPAPWYDPAVPESADFLGFLPLSVDGWDDPWPVVRTVTTAVTGGGALGPGRIQPRTITVTGILLGVSCCAVTYGLQWLSRAAQGCTGSACGGDCMTGYWCCPEAGMTAAEFNRRYRRTFRRTALISGPTITGRAGGDNCANRCGGAEVLTVEFVLSAATPWAYTDPTPVLDVNLPVVGTECVQWCLLEGSDGGEGQVGVCPLGSCHLKACRTEGAGCGDPDCVAASPPTPTAGKSCFCTAIAFETDCYAVDLSSRPDWSEDAVTFELSSGAAPLRNVQIAIYEKTAADDGLTCEQIAAKRRCEPLAVWNVSYLPADAVLTLDGEIGRSTVTCQGVCSSATNVWGRDGGAPTWPVLECATFCVCISVDALADAPASNAKLTMNVSGRGL